MNWTDLASRAAWTFAQTFIAIYAAAEFASIAEFIDLALIETAAVAGLAAVLSLVKTAVVTALPE